MSRFKLNPKNWTLFALTAAGVAVVAQVVVPAAAIWLAVGALLVAVVLRPETATPNPPEAIADSTDATSPPADDRDQLVDVVRDLSRALEISEIAHQQMHAVRNTISPLILDIGGVGELPEGEPRENMWTELRADVCETLGALHAQLQAEGPFGLPTTSASIADALDAAAENARIRVERPTVDAQVLVDGGDRGLANVFALFIANAMQRGATTVRVDVKMSNRCAAIAISDDGTCAGKPTVACHAAKARALLSGGEVEAAVSPEPIVLKLRLAKSPFVEASAVGQPFAGDPVSVAAARAVRSDGRQTPTVRSSTRASEVASPTRHPKISA